MVRVVLERLLDFYLFGEKKLVKLAKLNSRFNSFRFSSQSQAHLRYLLRRCPWWIAGHLELGFVELRLGELNPDKAISARLIGGAKISAEAARKLLGPIHLITKGRKLKLLLQARVLDGLVLAYNRKFEESLEVIKSVLALNNARLIPDELRYQALESAANCAYLTGNGNLALEFFNRVPEGNRSREGLLIMQALKTEA